MATGVISHDFTTTDIQNAEVRTRRHVRFKKYVRLVSERRLHGLLVAVHRVVELVLLVDVARLARGLVLGLVVLGLVVVRNEPYL